MVCINKILQLRHHIVKASQFFIQIWLADFFIVDLQIS